MFRFVLSSSGRLLCYNCERPCTGRSATTVYQARYHHFHRPGISDLSERYYLFYHTFRGLIDSSQPASQNPSHLPYITLIRRLAASKRLHMLEQHRELI